VNRTTKNSKITILMVVLVIAFSVIILNSTVVLSAEEKKEAISAGAQEEGIGDTGTDPRGFAPKLIPYYRFTELENGLEQKELVFSGLYAVSPKFAMTYEIPLAYERDIRSTDAFKNGLSRISGDGEEIPGGLPIGAELDGKETGIGDMNLRFMYRHDWDFLGFDWLTGVELVFPTASEDVLGSETFQIKPMVTMVRDIGFWPAPGAFFALRYTPAAFTCCLKCSSSTISRIATAPFGSAPRSASYLLRDASSMPSRASVSIPTKIKVTGIGILR